MSSSRFSPHCTRRRILATSTTVPLVLGGCLDRATETAAVDTRLAGLTVVNFDDERHVVHARMVEDDESVYERSLEVPAADSETGNPGEAVFEGIPAEAGGYVLHARRDDQTREERKTVDFREYDHECVELMIRVGDPVRDDLESYLSIWRSFGCSADG
ncbi:hypothetical protein CHINAEXTREME_19795 [Halobiforma lacisalsi AJ5]|uniref:Lipoprotein n=1 Tax=Natronobacterium lacisalsi AJ5 TaxID=358396 RepID=M0LR17_NATLA|nr:hypothetical protein [Halobiforma lacisalsi]APW99873.1 hypothetical protein CHINAEXTREME_19795 [Halobiforma lacisalsi AJ5]EMA35941.1 hypothetical protein C445_03758 [Halobiforma lacisalsi AJ5]